MAIVALSLDGEHVRGTILSQPNAIGVCTVQVRDLVVARPSHQLQPLDAEASKMLAGGDRFVTRSVDAVVAVAAKGSRPSGDWTIGDLEELHLYLKAGVIETQRHLGLAYRPGERDRLKALLERLLAASGYVKRWVKLARMERTAAGAGLTPSEAREPAALLRAAQTAIRELRRLYHERTGENAPGALGDVADAIGHYLEHHAHPGAAPAREVA